MCSYSRNPQCSGYSEWSLSQQKQHHWSWLEMLNLPHSRPAQSESPFWQAPLNVYSCAHSSLRCTLRGKYVRIWIKMGDQIHKYIIQRHVPWGWTWVWGQEAHRKLREQTWKHRDWGEVSTPCNEALSLPPPPRTDCTIPTRTNQPKTRDSLTSPVQQPMVQRWLSIQGHRLTVSALSRHRQTARAARQTTQGQTRKEQSETGAPRTHSQCWSLGK